MSMAGFGISARRRASSTSILIWTCRPAKRCHWEGRTNRVRANPGWRIRRFAFAPRVTPSGSEGPGGRAARCACDETAALAALPPKPLAPANDTPLIRASRTFSRREKDLDENDVAPTPPPRSLSLRERVAEGRVRGVSSTHQRRMARYPARGDSLQFPPRRAALPAQGSLGIAVR